MAARLKWYVYELVDPRSGEPFYIGKGCGGRMYTHLKKSHNELVNHRVREIRRKGLEPIARETAYFYKEEDALEHESSLIKSAENLLNIARNDYKAKRHIIVDVMDTLFGVIKGKYKDKDAALRLLVSVAIIRKLRPIMKDAVYREIYKAIEEVLLTLASKVEADRYYVLKS